MKNDLPDQFKGTKVISSRPNCLNIKGDRAMTTEQFNQIVASIIEGKYSWACVLILSFAGYDPLSYIPYRTYNRLLKENCGCKSRDQEKSDTNNQSQKQEKKSHDKTLVNIN